MQCTTNDKDCAHHMPRTVNCRKRQRACRPYPSYAPRVHGPLPLYLSLPTHTPAPLHLIQHPFVADIITYPVIRADVHERSDAMFEQGGEIELSGEEAVLRRGEREADGC